jgi:hypothetical protein
VIVSESPVGGKDAAIICHHQGIAQGSCTVLTLFLIWAGEHSSSFANLQRRLLWYCRMDCQLSSVLFLLLLLLICSSIGDENGVLKVNRAEERGRTKFSSELNVGTKSGSIWYFFLELKLKPKPKKTQKR